MLGLICLQGPDLECITVMHLTNCFLFNRQWREQFHHVYWHSFGKHTHIAFQMYVCVCIYIHIYHFYFFYAAFKQQ